MASYRSFVLRKLQSLAGVLPLGIFFFVHMTLNSAAAKGGGVYNTVIEVMRGFPNIWVYEWAIIFIPLIFHGVYGLVIWWTGKSNVGRYGFYRNWMYLFQRLTGIIAFLFLIYHVFVFRYGEIFFGIPELSFDWIAGQFTNPIVFAIYLIGLFCAAFHFGNGIYTFCITWGITVGAKSQKVVNYLSWIICIVFTLYGLNSMLAFLGKNIF
ncbi:MAG: succinate dehydrogenase [Peptococcaceae bacterium]|nr:succinate dehydrogenase [Peptococcaceae bacterium]